MSTPAAFSILKSPDVQILRWLEIEGLPYAYGTGSSTLSSSFFSSRAAAARFEGVKPWMQKPAPIEDVELDVLEAFPKHAAELQGVIVDVDGSIADLCNTEPGSARLSTDVADTDTTIVYAGDDPGFSAPGFAYIGNETIAYATHNAGTKTLGGITRGKFRSVAREWGRGIPIAVKPYTLAKRRVWYYLTAKTPSGSFSLTDAWLRFCGTLESFRATEELAAFEFRAASLEKELDRAVFRDLRNFTSPADSKIRGLDSTEGIDVYGQWPSAGVSDQLIANEFVLVRCGDELMGIKRVGSTEVLALVARGLFNTPIEEHGANSPMKEVVALNTGIGGAHTGDLPPGVREPYFSYFSSYPDGGSLGDGGGTSFAPDHPLAILLQVMVTGGPGGADGNGWQPPVRSFDLASPYVPDWFLGIDAARLDMRAICKLANETANLRVSGIIEEPVNFIEFARGLLRPFGFYATYTADGLLTVRPTRPPIPALNLRSLSNSHRIRKSRPGYDSNLSAVVSQVEYRYGYDLARGKFRRIVVLNVNEGELYSAGRGRRLVYESKILYTGRDRIPGEFNRPAGLDVVELLRQRGDYFQSRYARPPAIITETVPVDFADLALGDLISLTSSNSPNPNGGGRGFLETVAEVIGKRLDEEEKTIELTLILTGFRIADYRAIHWAALVQSDPSGNGTEIVLYSDVPGAKNGGRLFWYDYAGGAIDPLFARMGSTDNFVEFFGPGGGGAGEIDVYRNQGTPTEPVWNVNGAPDATAVVYGSNGSGDPTLFTSGFTLASGLDGALLLPREYAITFGAEAGTISRDGSPDQRLIWQVFAYLADNNGRIPGGNDPINGDAGHKLFPS